MHQIDLIKLVFDDAVALFYVDAFFTEAYKEKLWISADIIVN